MSDKNKKILVTTAIDYVNGNPHIGHALEKIQADVIARYYRQKGEDVFFLTGTDENSLKNVKAAKREGTEVKEYVDKQAGKFQEMGKALNLSPDDFIRTTENRHVKGAQKLWQVCEKDIYFDKYKGFYCTGCETYYKDGELKDNFCEEHQKPLEIIEEPAYFFKLSKYEQQIKQAIESNRVEIIPDGRKNEVLSFINSGLRDICISRSNERAQNWGIGVPGDKNQKIWCWFDALSNYITALGYGNSEKKLKKYWLENDNIIHVIGKGISRFHAVYWIGILIAADLLPDKLKIFVHGYVTVDGQKMSKSLGNVVDPFELVEKYGADPVRYFFLREISSTEDGDFTSERFESRYNADLASGLGNLVSRVLTLSERYKIERSSDFVTAEKSVTVKAGVDEARKDYETAISGFKFNEALAAVWQLISFCDKYIEQERPWEKSDNQLSVISDLLFVLAEIIKLIQPFMPETAKKITEQLKKCKAEALFPRL